ncbi:MAG: hypothetical protein JSS27_02060 [Planctomycetes bacterium]|nr:hypothetical protein [Planctomycetota bacterium]
MSKEAKTEAAAKPATNWKTRLVGAGGWLRQHWIGSLLSVSLGAHAIGYWYLQTHLAPPKAMSPEVSLGQFEYVAAPHVQGLKRARFQLHVELNDPRNEMARRQLSFHQFRLRQQLEETLRNLRGADFEDTKLGEVKRLLMAQIENVVGTDLTHALLITELTLDYGPQAPPRTMTQAADESPRL